jgi:hypothetical protein
VGNPKNCTVSFQDSDGVRHSVEVGAATLYEAAVLALKAFREANCARARLAALGRCAESERNAHAEHSVGRELAERRRAESERGD